MSGANLVPLRFITQYTLAGCNYAGEDSGLIRPSPQTVVRVRNYRVTLVEEVCLRKWSSPFLWMTCNRITYRLLPFPFPLKTLGFQDPNHLKQVG